MLNDGTIARQEPDGMEIVASMKRAMVAGDSVEWHETCYCSPPLKHERTTVYDRFFIGMETKPLNSASMLKGRKFWDHLKELQKDTSSSSSKFGLARLRMI